MGLNIIRTHGGSETPGGVVPVVRGRPRCMGFRVVFERRLDRRSFCAPGSTTITGGYYPIQAPHIEVTGVSEGAIDAARRFAEFFY